MVCNNQPQVGGLAGRLDPMWLHYNVFARSRVVNVHCAPHMCILYISISIRIFNSIKMCIPLIRKIVSWFGKWLTSGKGSHKISLYRNCAGTFNFARSPLIIISQPLASSSSDSYVCIAFAICLCFTR